MKKPNPLRKIEREFLKHAAKKSGNPEIAKGKFVERKKKRFIVDLGNL